MNHINTEQKIINSILRIEENFMYNPKSLKAEEFISNEEVLQSIDYAEKNKNNIELINQILDKAKERKGLSHREAAVLLAC